MNPERLRAIALAEWRGLPETPFPRHNAKSVGETLSAVLGKLGLKQRLGEEEVLAAWSEVVGEFVARQSSPVRLRDGVLIVTVLQPTVLYELDRVWKRDILGKLQSRFGARLIKEVKFKIG